MKNIQTKKKNRILEYVGDVPIHVSNRITLELHHKDYKPFVVLAVRLGIPVRWLMKMMMSPCQNCGNDKMTIHLTDMRHLNSNPAACLSKTYKKPPHGQSDNTDHDVDQ